MLIHKTFKFAATFASIISTVILASADIQKPNIVFVFADDIGSADLTSYGGSVTETPNIDALADKGIRFTQAYASAPICSPSRAGLLSGLHPARTGIHTYLHTRKGNRKVRQADYLDPKWDTLPRTLQNAGYATAHIGKWHLGGGRDVDDAPRIESYGYDEAISTWESPQPHPDLTAENWIWSADDKVKRWERTAFFVDKTLEFLARHAGEKPCFINLWPDDVHTPYVPDVAASKDRSNFRSRTNFAPVLAEFDRQIGRLLEGIEELGLADNTILIFTSDNGADPTYEGERSQPYRGSKATLWEGACRLPFIAVWSGKIPAGVTDHTTVFSHTDMFATLSRLAGVSSNSVPANSLDVSQALLGNPIGERAMPIFFEFNPPSDLAGRGFDVSPAVAIRSGKWKLLSGPRGESPELYDLSIDPGESNNVANQFPKVTKKLVKQIKAWSKDVDLPSLRIEL